MNNCMITRRLFTERTLFFTAEQEIGNFVHSLV
jgi:hypothetical protein